MMLRLPIARTCSAVAILILALGGVTPVAAQKTTLDGATLAASKNPAVIKNQLTLAAQFGRKALAGLEATSPDAPMPPEDSVVQPARDTYVLIRAALHGLEFAKESQRYPDPVIELAYKKVFDAWNLSRVPVDRAGWAPGSSRREYLALSVQHLRQALRLVDQALVLLP
jgi:hypothetical protein